jgi:hypothetical protein
MTVKVYPVLYGIFSDVESVAVRFLSTDLRDQWLGRMGERYGNDFWAEQMKTERVKVTGEHYWLTPY